MKIRNWNFNLFNFVSGATLVMLAMAISTQLASGQPRPLSLNQLQAVTGGGDCEGCRNNEDICRTEDETTCNAAATAGEFKKKVWTGQDAREEVTDAESGVMDAEASDPDTCVETWTGCDKVNGSCVNCESTSTTTDVNTKCILKDSTTCPAS